MQAHYWFPAISKLQDALILIKEQSGISGFLKGILVLKVADLQFKLYIKPFFIFKETKSSALDFQVPVAFGVHYTIESLFWKIIMTMD